MLRTLYTLWGVFVFNLLFVLLFPLLLIPILFPSQHHITGMVNRWWAKMLFTFIFVPFEVEERINLDRNKQYIFCPNHFSYLDIPVMGLNPVNTIFVGKNDMERVPLFGFMYRRLHITVDRANLRSRGNTVIASMKAVDQGKSLTIYIEGGIYTKNPPYLVPFKDGAFRTAIEKQIPLVPVTIPFNWKVMPDVRPLRLHGGRVKVIFHEPIETQGLTLNDIDLLKKKVFDVIDTELKQQNDLTGVSSPG